MKPDQVHPASLGHWIRPLLGALAVLGLLLCSPGAARGQTSSLVLDDTGTLERYGEIIERVMEFRSAGARKRERLASSIKKLVIESYALATDHYVTIELQTTDPNASGSGLNLSRDGNCVVGYLDNGFFTPYHAVRWIVGETSLDLGTLDPQNNASRFSFATDTNEDCSVVVGYSQIPGGAGEHAFRWTSAGGTMDDLNVDGSIPCVGRQRYRRRDCR